MIKQKHKWNPSISETDRNLYKVDKTLRNKDERIGFVKGEEQVIKLKETVNKDVDIREYIKIFIPTDEKIFRRYLELSKTGIRVLLCVFKNLEKNKDYIIINSKRFAREIGIDYNTVRVGIRELLHKNFLFMSEDNDMYWIDTTLFYKGNFEGKSLEYRRMKR